MVVQVQLMRESNPHGTFHESFRADFHIAPGFEIRNMYFRQTITGHERILFNARHTCRDRDTAQFFALTERTCSNLFEPIRQHNFSEPRPGKRIFPNLRHALRNRIGCILFLLRIYE